MSQLAGQELKMTFLVVFFTILWFIRFVKTHFKNWEKLAPHSASNSLSTGEHAIQVLEVDAVVKTIGKSQERRNGA